MDSEQQVNEWCRQAARGDRDAASKLLHGQYTRIFAYLRRLAGNDADAADLTQETFRKVWKSLDQFRNDSSVSTWMHRIAYCTWVDWVRQQRPVTTRSEHWWQELPGDFPSPFEEMETADQLSQLWKMIDELPEEQRMAIHLRYGQQLTLNETSTVLEIPLSTLKLRLRTALDLLRSRMTKSSDDLTANINPTTKGSK